MGRENTELSDLDINAVANVLYIQLKAKLIATDKAQTFTPYPTIATAEASPLCMLAFMSSTPQPGTTVQDAGYLDFALITAVRCEKGIAATWQAAEERLNTIESAVYMAITKKELASSYWTRVTYRQPSTRPPAPPEFPYWRWGEIYLRLYLQL